MATKQRLSANVQSLEIAASNAFGSAANPKAAVAMSKYMKDNFPYYGITSPERKEIFRSLSAPVKELTSREGVQFIRICWDKREREWQYLGFLVATKQRPTPSLLPTAKFMIVNKSWWDTVDEIAAHIVGPIVRNNHALTKTMDQWINSSNIWLIRTAILYQLGFKEQTDTARLFRYCESRSDENNFFIRKAIGWALREYAKTDPKAVKRFVAQHRSELSPLSIREALKHVG